MKYSLEFTKQALKDIAEIKKSTPKSFGKVESLLKELAEHPTTGAGRPETLKHDLTGYWSRRIDKKNRLVYQIREKEILVVVVSALGHYDDK